MIRKEPYAHSVDVWALGVLAFEMRVGQPPFHVDRRAHANQQEMCARRRHSDQEGRSSPGASRRR